MKIARPLVLCTLALCVALPAAASREDASDGRTPAPAPKSDPQPAGEKAEPAQPQVSRPAGPAGPAQPQKRPAVCLPPSERLGVNTLEDLYRAAGLEWLALSEGAVAESAADGIAGDAKAPVEIRWTTARPAQEPAPER